VALVGLASLACGGQVDPGGDGGGPSSSSSSGGITGGSTGSGSTGGGSVTVPPCPSEPPTPGMTCVAPGQQGCAYFTNQGCEAFLCGDSSVWQSAPEGC
jgi:hypothetical protein